MRWETAKPIELSEWDEQAHGVRQITDALEREGRFLILDDYFPVDFTKLPPNLFLRFATRMPLTEAAILAFVKDYGSLSSDTYSGVLLTHREGRRSGYEAYAAESFVVWEYEVKRMRLAVELWDALRLEGFGIEKYVQWTNDRRFIFKDMFGQIEEWPIQSFTFPIQDGDVIQFAKWRLMRLIESHLRNRVDVGYLRHDMKLVIEPTGLAGALWLQLARAIEAKANFKKCVICGEHFKTNRRDPETCSATCRKERSRREKRQTHLIRLLEEAKGLSWQERLDLWETWRQDDPELLRIKSPESMQRALELATTRPAHELKY